MFENMSKGKFRAYGEPDVYIYINGHRLMDWISFDVELNGLGEIDSFEITTQWDVSNEPRNIMLYSGAQGSADIVKGSAVIRIEAGFKGEEKTLIIEGDMDSAEWEFDNGERVTLSGRSYASRAYDFKETVKYQNLTATEAHAEICGRYGLTPVTPLASTELIGEYEGDDHANVAEETSHWDYVLYLAEQEGFVSMVRGTEWYFGPLEMLDEYIKEPLSFSYGHNIRELKIGRAANAARNITVEVVSWRTGEKKGGGSRIVEKAQIGNAEGSNNYIVRRSIPNITRVQAQKRVQSICAELNKQRFKGSFYCDYFISIKSGRRLALYGVGIGLSQVYYITKAEIMGSAKGGLECSVEFNNVPPESEG